MTERFLFDMGGCGAPSDERGTVGASRVSPTQKRREKVAQIAAELVAILKELDGIETSETFGKGYSGAETAIREIFAPLKKSKERDAEIDQTIIPNAELIVDAYRKGFLNLDIDQRNGSLGALAALVKFLEEQTPPF